MQNLKSSDRTKGEEEFQVKMEAEFHIEFKTT